MSIPCVTKPSLQTHEIKLYRLSLKETLHVRTIIVRISFTGITSTKLTITNAMSTAMYACYEYNQKYNSHIDLNRYKLMIRRFL